MNRIVIYLALLFSSGFIPCQTIGRTINFNKDWKFSLKGDSTCIVPGFNDKEWRNITLPHDWSIELPFDKSAPAGNDGGYLPTGSGWYRKTFSLDNFNESNVYKLKIGGAYMKSDVYVNGEYAGGEPYGYSTYFVDITPYLQKGENTVAIKVDNSAQKNCRWYSGSGLYRDVTLTESGPVRISDYGTYVRTPDLSTAEVDVFIDNTTSSPKEITVSAKIGDVAKSSKITVPAKTINFKAPMTITVTDAKPWSPDSPQLYPCEIKISENGNEIDSREQKIGFRTIAWDATEGFKLNGKPVILNGGCVHHDNGILGAAAYREAEYRRVKQLKDGGFNAMRTSHNIPSENFLDACDELGILVIDEAFDGWRDAKNDHDYHTLIDSRWKDDIDAMVLRDRNHPSIICWSIGNEVIERKKIEVVTTARKLASRCRELDPTRPVTSALCAWDSDWEIYDPLAEAHDIVGYNYMIHKAESDHDRNPGRVMVQTESYPAQAWDNFRMVKDHSYVIGDFVWTAIDYIGESGIGRYYYEGEIGGEHWIQPLYPWHGAYCGDIDLVGHRKPISHYRSMLWNSDGEHLYIAVKEPNGYKGEVRTTMWSTWPTVESWNWPGHEGKEIDVDVYSHYPTVRLTLNGKEIGKNNTNRMTASFRLPYNPGTLIAEGIDENGNVCETKTLSTAGKPAAIRINPESTQLDAENNGLSFLNIEVVDNKGNIVPIADNKLHVTVDGVASLLGLGNADIKDEDSYVDNSHKAWQGRAVAVVRATGKKGSTTVTVSSPGLKTAKVKLKSL